MKDTGAKARRLLNLPSSVSQWLKTPDLDREAGVTAGHFSAASVGQQLNI